MEVLRMHFFGNVTDLLSIFFLFCQQISFIPSFLTNRMELGTTIYTNMML